MASIWFYWGSHGEEGPPANPVPEAEAAATGKHEWESGQKSRSKHRKKGGSEGRGPQTQSNSIMMLTVHDCNNHTNETNSN